jgi:hypothetical protein
MGRTEESTPVSPEDVTGFTYSGSNVKSFEAALRRKSQLEFSRASHRR